MEFFWWTGHQSQQSPQLPELISLKDVADVASGFQHTLFLLKTGEVLACGRSSDGTLGTGTSKNQQQYFPKEVDFPFQAGDFIVGIGVGHRHSWAISNFRELFMWGDSTNYGVLGFGDTECKHTPTLHEGFRVILLTVCKVSPVVPTGLEGEGEKQVWEMRVVGSAGS